jgi:peroxiredoxin Q/BCP
MALKVKVGEIAPDFELQDLDGKKVKLSSFRGKKIVLYFYPEDDTPGCTTQACDFRDGLAKFRNAGYEVVGISPDPPEKHKKFVQKYGLNYTLLCDTSHTVMEKYGVWGEKENYGKKYVGVWRTTLLIDQSGKITHVFEKVKAEGHAAALLAAIGAK